MIKLFSQPSRNGMNGFHFMASNCHDAVLRLVSKCIFRLSSEMDRSDNMASQDSSASTTIEKATNALTSQANDKQNIFHFAIESIKDGESE
jgi:hypothetical protein